MVDPVADLLQGRGHPVRRVREVGLATDDDAIIADYAVAYELVLVTFDPDLRRSVVRRDARCLHIRGRERTARDRLANYYRETVGFFWQGARLVTLPSNGPPVMTHGPSDD
jgi:predicted nuclease of predicted toxin-antitoxin system